MDDLTKVRELRAEAPAPDRARLAPGRMRLLDAAENGRALRRTVRIGRDWRFAAVGAVLAVTASAVLAVNLADHGGSDVSPKPAASQSVKPGTAQEFLEAAARAAESVRGAEPQDDQWYYTKSIGASVEPDTGELGKPTTDEDWFTVGPRKGEEGDWRTYYRLVTHLPDDPQGIVRAIQEAYPPPDAYALDSKKPTHVFSAIQSVTRTPLTSLEGKGQAKLYRALASLEGIELVGHRVTDAAGREVVAITVKPEPKDRYRYEILLQPDTYQVVGSRMVVAHDFTDTNEETAFFPGTWKAGDVMNTGASLVRTFVDDKNERP
ncbi:CU044_5270 family protein [Streptomyces sp. TRM66268-LWL]|uniref:CU044_5270 family protein n=1 Tax=Streptomyces polyasparticus TaxID=2767826 RepID=A0ABR7SB04_9ACTN|nr:CU044_5270 family protein [Streptomyces polyasparticus]MBC9711940.1 CU044_5270 family protein [Streptomyces polyasparticus]